MVMASIQLRTSKRKRPIVLLSEDPGGSCKYAITDLEVRADHSFLECFRNAFMQWTKTKERFVSTLVHVQSHLKSVDKLPSVSNHGNFCVCSLNGAKC